MGFSLYPAKYCFDWNLGVHGLSYNVKQISKLPAKAFDRYLTCQLFSVQWAHFPIRTDRIAQWLHQFSMNLNDLLTIYDSLSITKTKLSLNGTP